jgi:hypothetical protein
MLIPGTGTSRTYRYAIVPVLVLSLVLVGKGYSVPCSNCDDDEQKDSNNNNDEHSDRMDAENESQAACYSDKNSKIPTSTEDGLQLVMNARKQNRVSKSYPSAMFDTTVFGLGRHIRSETFEARCDTDQ